MLRASKANSRVVASHPRRVPRAPKTGKRNTSKVCLARCSDDVDDAPARPDPSFSCNAELAPSSRRGLLFFASSAGAAMIANAVGTGAARAVPFSDEISAEIRAELLEEDAAARARVQRIREKAEVQGRASGGGFEDKLCATPFGVDVVGITEAIALIGALVGGISARQRKREVEIVNEKLRRVNLSLRQQARAGTLYAPGLRYAPSASATATAIPSIVDETAAPVVVESPLASPPTPQEAAETSSSPTTITTSVEDVQGEDTATPKTSADGSPLSDIEREVIYELKLGKRLLSEDEQGSAGSAVVHFNKALLLSRKTADRIRERRAVRGIAAARRKTGDVKGAIAMLERVLEISKEVDEYTGDSDAYGTIADLYTELGDYEKAGRFYDRYIDCMSSGE
ncbi:hypothetical protein PPROV_000145000 [Pycnococcus provasolii]|uniref:Uncharacterized protein n=1 Tax=Pycnococcus provasolii TaxID=41880 RepID=A0A830H6M7_9CHLO|nr:hypothetical protein PPROV_000145000 [Pycnococcus provasolii]